MKWLEKIPLPVLLLIVVAPGLAPFVPEPHIWQKIKMLMDGGLTKSIDIFDLIFHGTPFLLLALKLYWMSMHKNK